LFVEVLLEFFMCVKDFGDGEEGVMTVLVLCQWVGKKFLLRTTLGVLRGVILRTLRE
jgi:hypothetical protein